MTEVTHDELVALQKDAGIPHLPTSTTYHLRMGVNGEGPRAYDWSDKPHRLVYDACRHAEAQAEALAVVREEITAIADNLMFQLEEPWPGSDSARLHYWRDKAIKAANDIKAKLNELEK
jgi:hypothetical protein